MFLFAYSCRPRSRLRSRLMTSSPASRKTHASDPHVARCQLHRRIHHTGSNPAASASQQRGLVLMGCGPRRAAPQPKGYDASLRATTRGLCPRHAMTSSLQPACPACVPSTTSLSRRLRGSEAPRRLRATPPSLTPAVPRPQRSGRREAWRNLMRSSSCAQEVLKKASSGPPDATYRSPQAVLSACRATFRRSHSRQARARAARERRTSPSRRPPAASPPRTRAAARPAP